MYAICLLILIVGIATGQVALAIGAIALYVIYENTDS